jgi:hypothetical protein
MRVPWVFLSAAVAMMASNCVRAAEPEPGAVEESLRAQGFVQMKAPPECGHGDSRQSIYFVSGDIANPVISGRASAAQTFQTSLRGKRFEYASENRGEWGGTLRARDGRNKPRVLLEANVIHLLPAGDDLFVFDGLDHLGVDFGAVHIVADYDSAPRERLFTQLPGMPTAIAMDPKTRRIAIVTEFSVSEIWGNRYYTLLTARHFRFPRATSALVAWPNMLIGHCGGVALLEFPWRRNRPPAPDGTDQITIVTYWTRR